MKQLIIIILFMAFINPVIAYAGNGNKDFENKVRETIIHQMEIYPESELKDLYKLFFQDRFGPGHLINDTIKAKQYLLNELNSYSEISGDMFEYTGWEHNFCRVNLSVIKNGLISADVLLNALVKSANQTVNVSLEDWKKEWSLIETIINQMDIAFPNYEEDLKEIENRLSENKYVGHHSDAYNKAYNPHYRIIDSKIFKEEILPFLNN